MKRVAIIGAGISGLAVARRLAEHHDVTVFEKSNGVGGRMATRYAGRFEFDHGAQFFTARTLEFQAFLQPLLDAGVVADWNARFVEIASGKIQSERQWDSELPHYVGVPRMNAIGKWLAQDVETRLGVEVARMLQQNSQWQLFGNENKDLGYFDWVIITAPAPQARFLAPTVTSLSQRAAGTCMEAGIALMLGFEKPLDINWQAALVHDADVSWVSLNSSKPGRGEAVTLVAHSTNAWADQHSQSNLYTVQSHLLAECSRATGIDAGSALHQAVHRWRFANVGKQQGDAFFIDPERHIAACGDWFVRGRVEAAFTSGHSLALALQPTL